MAWKNLKEAETVYRRSVTVLAEADRAHRAREFKPNGTIVKEFKQFWGPMSDMVVDQVFSVGDRVQVTPGQSQWQDWSITRQDGKVFELDSEYVQLDGAVAAQEQHDDERHAQLSLDV